MAVVLARLGRPNEALTTFGRATELARATRSERALAITQVTEAEFLESLGDRLGAAALFQAAEERLRGFNAPIWLERAEHGHRRCSGQKT